MPAGLLTYRTVNSSMGIVFSHKICDNLLHGNRKPTQPHLACISPVCIPSVYISRLESPQDLSPQLETFHRLSHPGSQHRYPSPGYSQLGSFPSLNAPHIHSWSYTTPLPSIQSHTHTHTTSVSNTITGSLARHSILSDSVQETHQSNS